MLSSSSLLPKGGEKNPQVLYRQRAAHIVFQHVQNNLGDLKQAGGGGDLLVNVCEELRFGAGCPVAAQRGGEVLWFTVWGCSASRCAFGSSFPQQSEQLQCETLGHLIFPPSDPNACLLHRDFLPDHSWGHIWTETHRSHPREGTRRTTVPWSCPPGPSAQTAQAGGGQGEQRCLEMATH